MDARELLEACLAFEAEHGAAALIVSLSEIVENRAQESGIEIVEDTDGNVELILPVMN